MGLVPNLEFMGVNTKSPKKISCLITIHKSGVGLLKIGFLACLAKMGGPS